MKIKVIHANDGWRWSLHGANNKIVATGEAYQRPQKMVQMIDRYIVRGDPELQLQFAAALEKFGLDPSGKQLRIPVEEDGRLKWKDPK